MTAWWRPYDGLMTALWRPDDAWWWSDDDVMTYWWCYFSQLAKTSKMNSGLKNCQFLKICFCLITLSLDSHCCVIAASLNRHWYGTPPHCNHLTYNGLMMLMTANESQWRPMTANDDVMTADDDVMTADDDVMTADDDVMTHTTVQNILPIILIKYKINSKYYPIVSKLLPIHNIIIKHPHTKIQSISRASFVIIRHRFSNLYAFLTQ